MADRPVHYVSHGSTTSFDCYQTEIRAWVAQVDRIQAEADAKFPAQPAAETGEYGFYEKRRAERRAAEQRPDALPHPLRSTDLWQVTCRDCWVQIHAKATTALKGR